MKKHVTEQSCLVPCMNMGIRILTNIAMDKRDRFAVGIRFAILTTLLLTPTLSRAQQAQGIRIEEASYGLNCGAQRNNVVADISYQCNGTKNCSYQVNHRRIGDPAVGCAKNYIVTWSCPGSAQRYQRAISPEASGREIQLSCGDATSAIRVRSATYGENCGATWGNATQDLEARCNGSKSCNYRVDHQVIGDPAVGCPKTYQFSYKCGSAERQGDLPAEATGRFVRLSCE